MSGTLSKALGAAALSLAGVGAAWLWLNISPILPIGVTVVAVGIGAIAGRFAESALPDDPLRCVKRYEWWIVAPAAAAVFGACALIVLALYLADDSWSDENKQLVAAGGAALTAFITTTTTKAGEDGFGGLGVGDRVKSAFQKEFKGRFEAGSAPSNYVFSEGFAGIVGWGHAERRKRAEKVAEALRS